MSKSSMIKIWIVTLLAFLHATYNFLRSVWRICSGSRKANHPPLRFVLRMTSLLPEDVVLQLKSIFGKKFDKSDQRIALVTTKAEGCVTHRRLIELSKEHPSEPTRILHGLVDKKILKSEDAGKGTFYYLIGEHPIKGDIVRSSDSAEKSFEHLDGRNSEQLIMSSEQLTANSEHLDNKSSEHLEQKFYTPKK